MRIAVIGAGGVGGAFGAALAKGGSDVTFLARGAHLAAMRERGLKVLGPRGAIHLQPTKATDDPAASGAAGAGGDLARHQRRAPGDPPAVGAVDPVVFCVKLWVVETAGAPIRPLVGKT